MGADFDLFSTLNLLQRFPSGQRTDPGERQREEARPDPAGEDEADPQEGWCKAQTFDRGQPDQQRQDEGSGGRGGDPLHV